MLGLIKFQKMKILNDKTSIHDADIPTKLIMETSFLLILYLHRLRNDL